jgi:hypothetical protein
VTLALIVTGLRTACKHCLKRFAPERAGAQYCSPACRTAAYRKRHAPLPNPYWVEDDGRELKFSSAPSRAKNYDGTSALQLGELAARLLEIADDDDDGKPKTGRRFYYLALSYGHIQPDMGDTAEAKKSRNAAYDRVTDALDKLRKMGRLGWDMVLDLTRDLDQWRAYASPREARAEMRSMYDEDRWLGQRYYPIFIVEKDTMEPVCQPMAMRWRMPFASSRGNSSLKLQHDVAELLLRRHAKIGQVAIVYFVSDHDPSGFDLQRAWEEALQGFGTPVRFVRIGLTTEQVGNSDLDIERLAIAVKPSDSRSKTYIAEHGSRCWEADVLPAAVIEQALDAHVSSWLDGRLWRRRDVEIERARGLL